MYIGACIITENIATLQKQNCYYNKKMFVSWDRNKLKFVQITIFSPKLIHVCKYFLCEITFFFGLFDQFILCYLRFITKTNLIC